MNAREKRFHELSAGRALGTLSEEERWELDELLDGAEPEALGACEELEFTALHLPAGAELVDPPTRVKERLLAAVREEPRRESLGDRLARSLNLLRPQVAFATMALLFAVTVAAVGLGLYSAHLDRTLDQEMSRTMRLTEDLERTQDLLGILRAQEVKVIRLNGLEIHPESYGKLLWDPENRTAVLQVANLPAAPDDQEYQLWIFSREQDPVSPGTFAVRASRQNTFFRFADFPTVDRRTLRGFLVTLEPRGGAATPGEAWYLGARVEPEAE